MYCNEVYTTRVVRMDSEQFVERIANYASEKKATDIVVLDLRGVVGYTDFFLVCTGNTDRQTRAIYDAIYYGIKQELQSLPAHTEGLDTGGEWVLMDYLDVIVHIFTPELREYYRLEQLWGEVPVRKIEEK